MKRIKDGLHIEEGLKAVASAWNLGIKDLKKPSRVSSVPRAAFSYLICDLMGEPPFALAAINVRKEPRLFRFLARQRVEGRPLLKRKVIGLKFQVENNIIRFSLQHGNSLVPHDVRLVEALKAEICSAYNIPAEGLLHSRNGHTKCARQAFANLACDIYGQPKSILHHIGLPADSAASRFLAQARKWRLECSEFETKRLESIRIAMEKSDFQRTDKEEKMLLTLAFRETAGAWQIDAEDGRDGWPDIARLAFSYLTHKLLFLPRDSVSRIGIRSPENQRLLCERARRMANSDLDFENFVFKLRDRVKAILRGDPVPERVFWRNGKSRRWGTNNCAEK